MAGDWIKMRSELATHPRFFAIANELIYGDDCGLLVYACGEDALGIGALPPSNESVTDRALRCVTERALRDVTLSALTRVWCSVNSHCKVDGTDAVMAPMILEELDTIAGFSGFGHAMEVSGWVVTDGDNSLRFPNFLEFNEPACLRKQAKTGAERAREFRARRREQTGHIDARNETSRTVTKRNGREEKRREESKEENTPIVPSRKQFSKPTVDDVRAYCLERSNTVDPQAFIDHYESNGWMVGKAHMKDWRAAVRTWERNSNGKQKPKQTRPRCMTKEEIDLYNATGELPPDAFERLDT
jgi:hypothetical protein